MSGFQRPRLPLAVEPLDESSRALLHGDERTFTRDEDLPSTEPDGFANDKIARERDSVLDALNLIEEQRQKTPRDAPLPHPAAVLLPPERETEPSRAASSPSEVFAPLGARERVLDADAATPRDRPFRHIEDNKPTDLDVRQAATATMQQAPQRVDFAERTEPLPRHERETENERLLMKSVCDTERVYLALKDIDPVRAAHVHSLFEHLSRSPAYSERDVVLQEHARERRALNNAAPHERDQRENRVMAVALVAHDLDERYRALVGAHKEKLVAELPQLPPDKRDAVFHDFESFCEKDAANDSAHCRRQLHDALKHERELHKAYVYALALDRKQQQRTTDERKEP